MMSEKKLEELALDIKNLQKKEHELELELADVRFQIKLANIKLLRELFLPITPPSSCG